MLRNSLSTFKFLNSQEARLYVLFCKQVTLFWQKISSFDIKLIDVIKEINYRKNKLPFGAIESALKSLRMEGEPKLDQFRGLFVPLAKRFPGLPCNSRRSNQNVFINAGLKLDIMIAF